MGHDLKAGTDVLEHVLLVLLPLEDLTVDDDHWVEVGSVVLPFDGVLLENLVGIVCGALFSTASIRTFDASIKQILLKFDSLKT